MKETNYEFCLEMQGSRLERTNKRMFVIIIILIVSLLATNSGWLWFSRQFKVETITTSIDAEQKSDGDGTNYIIGGDYAGPTESESNENR